MTPQNVRYMIEKHGVSIVCATCKKFWEGRAKGLPELRCVGVDCSGPIAGGDFPEYDGDLPLEKFCFVCGKDSEYGAHVQGKDRVVGICKGHLHYLTDMLPKSTVKGSPLFLKKDGKVLLIEEVVRPTKPTILQQMAKTEMEWADADSGNSSSK